MKRFERAAVVCDLINRLREAGSWAGETHVQKATYLLQDLLAVPLNYGFILYKHGPFSFELSDDLAAFLNVGLIEEQVQAPPYGPRFAATPRAATIKAEYRNTLNGYSSTIEMAARTIGTKSVGEVERLATALYVTKRAQDRHDGSVRTRAAHLNRLKPHVPLEAAAQAVEQIDLLVKQIATAETVAVKH